MPEQFDLAVIGTGAAATTVAYRCRAAGWSVAIADSRPFGGTCANRGCDPKKALVGAVDLADHARRMHARGVSGRVRIDWPELMRFKRTFTDAVPANTEHNLEAAGVQTLHGIASFVNPETIDIGGVTVTARYFLIAAGATPVRLNIPGEELLINSDQFLDLEHLPGSVLFVGGGYIAFEFAHLAARAGARVTVLHRGARPLERFDADLVERLVSHSRAQGIDLRLDATVERIESEGQRRITCATQPDRPLRIETELAVHAAGRAPNLGDLNLAAAQVDAGPRGVAVNKFLQSVSNPRVYAAGDAADSGGLPLTPVAGYEGRIAAANLLDGNRLQPDYRGCASTVFSIPPLAMVGLTEAAAREQQLDFDVHQADTTGWYSSRRIAEECSAYKTLVERGTGHILGAHVLGAGAEELINIFALGIRTGLTAAQLTDQLYAYPSRASDIRYMLE